MKLRYYTKKIVKLRKAFYLCRRFQLHTTKLNARQLNLPIRGAEVSAVPNNQLMKKFLLKISSSFVLMLAVVAPGMVWGQVTITAGSATAGACPGYPTAPVTVSNIIITENVATNFSGTNLSAGSTLIFCAPAGFQFVSAGNVSVSNPGDIATATITLTNPTTLTISLTGDGNAANSQNELDVFTISGVQIIATAAGSGNITRCGGTQTVNGLVNGTAVASLTTSSGTTPTVTLTSGNNNQSVCNTSITNITYSIGAPATSATVTGLPTGVSASFSAGVLTISGTPTVAGTFNYTVTTTGSVCSNSATGTISSSLVCNDNPCNAFTLPVSAGSCSAFTTGTNVNATYSTGMVDPPCAIVNGPDVWYAITVPASGQLQVSADAGGTFDEMLTLYDGSCSNLQFAGCVNGVAGTSNVYPLTYAGAPGSTIYLRVNEGGTGDASTGSFNICAYEATTVGVSQVLPGVTTTVTCGSTLNFYDTGGQGGTTTTNTSQPPPAGNYTNNSGTTWTICPSDPTQYVTLTFNQFLLESGFDKMIITSGSNNVIAQWTGNQGQGDVVSAQNPGECLTIYFQSDYSFTALGWEAVVSCQGTRAASQVNNECSVNNCTGGCGVWVCADGIYNTVAGSGAGVDEINEVTGGCWGAAGEVATSWFYFTTSTSGSLAFEFVPSNSGHNINFALYGPTTNGAAPCPTVTGDAPIRCSFTDIGGSNTGLRAGESDLYDGPVGNSFAAPLQVSAGQTYALVVDVYQNGQPPTQTQIDFTGAAGLDCAVLLPIELISFEGINQNDKNLLSWVTASQLNNDFFTIERSADGQNWSVVSTVNGAGTTNHTLFYSLEDYNPFFPVTYYRLKQTDYDGKGVYVKTISVTNRKNMDGDFVSNLFPNPSSEYATFSFNGFDTKTPLNVSIVNSMGEVITNVNYTSLFREMPITLITTNLSNGVYQVVFTQGDNTQVQKLSIIR
jgi:hypothetical protein